MPRAALDAVLGQRTDLAPLAGKLAEGVGMSRAPRVRRHGGRGRRHGGRGRQHTVRLQT